MIATKVTDIRKGWKEQYFWRSDTKLCFFRPNGAGEQVPNYDLIELDTATSQAEDLVHFNATATPALKARSMVVSWQGLPGEELHHDPPWFAASPDGNWLSWCTYASPDGSANQPGWFAGALDRPMLHSWNLELDPYGGRTSIAPPMWTSDSRCCIALSSAYQNNAYRLYRATLRGVGSNDVVEVVDLPHYPDGMCLGLDADNSLILRHPDWSQVPMPVARFQRIPLSAGAPTAEVYEVRLTRPAEVCDVSLSPDRRSLAWVLVGPDRRNGPYEIWLSDLAGGQMRLVQEVQPILEPCPSRIPGFNFHYPRNLGWLPSGRSISYFFQNAIWKVPLA